MSTFMSRVDTSGDCWTWLAYKNPQGYGQLSDSSRRRHLAHRYAYSMFVGNIPQGAYVLHSCDNPACVKPTHLRIGDQSDNMRDKALRERGTNKLTNRQAREIRDRYIPRGSGNGYGNTRMLAEEYGVSRYTIHEIATGRSRSFA